MSSKPSGPLQSEAEHDPRRGGLELSHEKSRVTDVGIGFAFLGALGATLREYDGKLLMTPAARGPKGTPGQLPRDSPYGSS